MKYLCGKYSSRNTVAVHAENTRFNWTTNGSILGVPLQQVVLWDNFYAAEKCFCEMWPPPRLTWDALAYVKALKGSKSLHTVMSNGLLKLKGKTYPWERLSLVYAGKQDIKLYVSYWIVKYISENAHSLC